MAAAGSGPSNAIATTRAAKQPGDAHATELNRERLGDDSDHEQQVASGVCGTTVPAQTRASKGYREIDVIPGQHTVASADRRHGLMCAH